jgi:hypothetical protein
MQRELFYEVKREAYLFPDQSLKDGDQDHPEEAVRQWCAYELIRAYGIPITDLEFERPVRVGSKTYRIDILVSRCGVPWGIIECKEPGHDKPAEGIAQAISYADAQEIRAEFAVYTNGKTWHVQRRVLQKWIVVVDLPHHGIDPAGAQITELFNALQELAPLLYKLDDPIEGDNARRFLSAMQVFFCGVNLLNQDINRNLLEATDNLLRVLASSGDSHYQFGKLATAQNCFELFRKEIGHTLEICPMTGRDPLCVEMQFLHVALMNVVEGSNDLTTCDTFVLRLNTALLEYGRSQRDPQIPYPPIGPSLHHALRDYLRYALSIYLNAILPDPLDNIGIGDMKCYCHSAWERLEAEDHVTFREFVSVWTRWVLFHLKFWERPPR